MNKFCVIFGSNKADKPRKKFGKNDFIITTVDGYAKAVEFEIEPDAVIGDFSTGATLETDAFVVKIARDKDDPDVLAALKVGLRRGYTQFIIYGGAGVLENAFADIAALGYLNAYAAQGFLIDGERVATVITDGKLTLPETTDGEVSVFAYGGTASGVTLKNFVDPLENAELDPSLPRGTSKSVSYKDNALRKKKAEISVKHGSLLVFFPR